MKRSLAVPMGQSQGGTGRCARCCSQSYTDAGNLSLDPHASAEAPVSFPTLEQALQENVAGNGDLATSSSLKGGTMTDESTAASGHDADQDARQELGDQSTTVEEEPGAAKTAEELEARDQTKDLETASTMPSVPIAAEVLAYGYDVEEKVEEAPGKSSEKAKTHSKEFTVQIDKEQGKLGMVTDSDDGAHLVITAISDNGHLQAWNASHPDHEKVTVGDRVLSVNGVKGEPAQLLKLLDTYRWLKVVIRRHTEFSIALVRPGTEKLGIELRFREGGHTLLVRKVGEGMLEEWNRKHCGLELKVGDRIVAVNGVRGEGSLLNSKVKSKGSLILDVARFEPKASSS